MTGELVILREVRKLNGSVGKLISKTFLSGDTRFIDVLVLYCLIKLSFSSRRSLPLATEWLLKAQFVKFRMDLLALHEMKNKYVSL